MAKKKKPAAVETPKPRETGFKPTSEDPLCECGAPKHAHELGTGAYVGGDPAFDCDEFAQA